MNLLKQLFVLLLLLQFLPCMGQQPDYLLKENAVWTFGAQNYGLDTGTGLNFNSGTPITIGSKLLGGGTSETSVADSNGNLLFYTDGTFVADANNDLMPHGDSLIGDTALYQLENFSIDSINHYYYGVTSSGVQGALIIPVLSNPNRYYIFSLTSSAFYPENAINENSSVMVSRGYGSELYYSIVDMSLNGGKGDVVASQRGIFLDSNLSMGMIAVAGRHCDIWILVHSIDTSIIYAYNVSANGINPTPVVSYCGTFPAYTYIENYGIAASPDRSKIVLSSFYGADLCDFNNATGVVSNSRRLHVNCPSNFYFGMDTSQNLQYVSNVAACFSPDNSKLYLEAFNEVDARTIIFQCDSTNDFANNVQLTPYSWDSDSNAYWYWTDMELGNDGKMYLVQYNPNQIACVASPNLPGFACNYVPHAANTYPGSFAGFGLHNSFVKAIRTYTSQDIFDFDTSLCYASSGIALRVPTNYYNFSWNTGSEDSVLVTNSPGIYVLQSINYCGVRTDTFVVTDCQCSPFIPNAFTPNSDGKNDVFHVLFAAGCPVEDFTLDIYNRWGTEVFTTNDISAKWDGNFNGTKQNMDTYMYQLKYRIGTNGQMQYQKGDITLVR